MQETGNEYSDPDWMPKQPQSGQQINPYMPPKAISAPGYGSDELLPHQKAGRVIRLMAWLGVLATVGIGASILIPPLASGKAIPHEIVLVLGIVSALSVGLFFVAAAVLRHVAWGRAAGIGYGLILLLGFPLGTLIGVYILWNLIAGWRDGDPELKLM